LSQPTVSVIIVGYDGERHLPACLDSVAGLDYPREQLEVIVVDNASRDRSVEVAGRHRDRFVQFQLIELRQNMGYGGAINIAASAAHGDILAFLNQDIVLEPASLRAAVDVLQRQVGAGIVGYRVTLARSDSLYAAGSILLPGMFSWNYRDREGPCDAVSGAALLIRRPIFEKVGGCDSSYFMYYDETDLCRRVTASGWTVWYCKDARALHFTSASSSRKSPFVLFHMVRNRTLVLVRLSSHPKLSLYLDLLLYYPLDLLVNMISIVQSPKALAAVFRARWDSLRRLTQQTEEPRDNA